MQAARALAGLTIDELAAKVAEEDGLSARSLRDIESGRREHLAPSKRRAILVACDLPPALLQGDIWWLQELLDAMDTLPDSLLEQRMPDEIIREAFRLLAERERTLEEPAHSSSDETMGELLQRLEGLETTMKTTVERAEAAIRAVAGERPATQVAVDLSRGVTGAAKAAVGPADQESEAAPSTRDEEDAKTAADQPRREATQ